MWEPFPARVVCVVLVVGGVWLAVAGVLVVVGRLVGLGWRGAWACGIGGYFEKRISDGVLGRQDSDAIFSGE